MADCACYPQSNCENQFCVKVTAIRYWLFAIRVTVESQFTEAIDE